MSNNHGKRYELMLIDAIGMILTKDGFDSKDEAMNNYIRIKATLESGQCSEPRAQGTWLRDLHTQDTLGFYMLGIGDKT